MKVIHIVLFLSCYFHNAGDIILKERRVSSLVQKRVINGHITLSR